MKSHGNIWTKEEEIYIAENKDNMTFEEIGKVLGRTAGAVENRYYIHLTKTNTNTRYSYCQKESKKEIEAREFMNQISNLKCEVGKNYKVIAHKGRRKYSKRIMTCLQNMKNTILFQADNYKVSISKIDIAIDEVRLEDIN